MTRQDIDNMEIKVIETLEDMIQLLKNLADAYAEISFFFPFKEFEVKRETDLKTLNECYYLITTLKGDDNI